MKKTLFLTGLLSGLLHLGGLAAQEMELHDSNTPVEHYGIKGSHPLTGGIGHTHISQGIIDGKTRWLALASWTINYDYWISD